MRPFISVLLLVVSVRAFSASTDSIAVIETSEKYIRAFYENQPSWLEEVLHPALIKRTLKSFKGSDEFVQTNGKSEMVELSKVFNVSGKFNKNSKAEIELLDLYQEIATVKLTAEGWIDYLHLIKVNGRWQIVNVVWLMI